MLSEELIEEYIEFMKTNKPSLEKKPEHNKYDNIFEIRQERQDSLMYKIEDELRRGDIDDYFPIKEGIYYYRSLGGFFKRVLLFMTDKGIDLPVLKIVCPHLEWNIGAIYYIVRHDKTRERAVYRGTYGYRGTGCHESACIEEFLHRIKITPSCIKLLDADRLLGALGLFEVEE